MEATSFIKEDENRRSLDPLVSWIVNHVEQWEEFRDEACSKHSEYYRIWRGMWNASDKERQAERSRIIAPATQQAVESQVAELEESIFARKRWIDFDKLADFTDNEEHNEIASEIILEELLEDLEHVDVKSAVSEALLNGALYGTGVVKIVVEEEDQRTPVSTKKSKVDKKIIVRWVPIDPAQFAIDPTATSIDAALGVAHTPIVPKHEVQIKQSKGIYEAGPLGDRNESLYRSDREESRPQDEDKVELIEYHGLVPTHLLPDEDTGFDLLSFAEVKAPKVDTGDMTEVIVVIANRNKRLSVTKNPFIMQDRGFVSFQFDTVPNRFYGRGVVEKAYNAQKALDTELRARIDSLGLSTYPMTIVNTLMAPRSLDASVTPGKRVFVNGAPSDALDVLKLPGPDANSYRHANDLERMVQMATGSVAPTSPMGVNPTNETASGMSMMLGAMFKRTKRTLRNVEQGVLIPAIHKTVWRYMQFRPDRYPVQDYRFIVTSGLGASAREFEVAQLNQFLQTMPPGSPEYWTVLLAVLENFSVDSKEELIGFVRQRIQSSMEPQEDPELALRTKELELKERELAFKMQSKVEELSLKAQEVEAEARRDEGEAKWNESTALVNQMKAEAEARAKAAEAQEKQTAAVLNLAKAKAEADGQRESAT